MFLKESMIKNHHKHEQTVRCQHFGKWLIAKCNFHTYLSNCGVRLLVLECDWEVNKRFLSVSMV